MNIQLLLGDYKKVLASMPSVDLILTSPPYNLGRSRTKKTGKRAKGQFDGCNWGGISGYVDNLPELEYQQQQQQFLKWAISRLKDSGNLLYIHKIRKKHGRELDPMQWISPLVSEQVLINRERIVWDRGSTHNHTKAYVYSQSERIYRLTKPVPLKSIYFQNQDLFWKNKRNSGAGDVWYLAKETNNTHNAPFPLALARQCIRMYCPLNGQVCDPYSGSGTTMLAAYLENRAFIGAEIMPKYYKTANDRLTKRNQQ